MGLKGAENHQYFFILPFLGSHGLTFSQAAVLKAIAYFEARGKTKMTKIELISINAPASGGKLILKRLILTKTF